MPLITWTNDLSVNVKEIDSQHKRLINLINELHDAMTAGRGKDIIGRTLTELIDYTRKHFFNEEGLLKTQDYPDYPSHKAEHDKLTQKVMDFKKDFDAGKSIVTIEVMRFLKDWLSSHIMKIDKAYTPHLNSKGLY